MDEPIRVARLRDGIWRSGAIISCQDGPYFKPAFDFSHDFFELEACDAITVASATNFFEVADGKNLDGLMLRTRIAVVSHHASRIVLMGHQNCLLHPGGLDEQLQSAVRAVLQMKQWDFICEFDPKFCLVWVVKNPGDQFGFVQQAYEFSDDTGLFVPRFTATTIPTATPARIYSA